MDKYLQWFLENVVLVIAILFVLQGVAKIEFNEYPHDETILFGNSCSKLFNEHCFCANWNNTGWNKPKLLSINFSFYDKNCSQSKTQWKNPSENRVNFYLGYELRLVDIRDYNSEVRIEVTSDQRSFILFSGKRFP